jgi:hypothetical protein
LPDGDAAFILPQSTMEEGMLQSVIELEEPQSADEILVHEWRTEQLERLGITRIVAEAVAGLVDWHEIARLIERGCPPALAVEIVR